LASAADPELQRDLLIAATTTTAAQPRSSAPVVPEASRDTIGRLLASIPDGETRARTTAVVITANGGSAPAWCADLWAGLPPEQQKQAGPAFFRQAASANADIALAAYSASSPEVQMEALKGLCSGLASTRPEQALQLVLQRDDPVLQAECAAALFAGWARHSSEAAFAALETNAGQLDLRAILAQLPGIPGDDEPTTFKQIIQASARSNVEAKLHDLLGDPAPAPASSGRTLIFGGDP
jgi:hypothetical protein